MKYLKLLTLILFANLLSNQIFAVEKCELDDKNTTSENSIILHEEYSNVSPSIEPESKTEPKQSFFKKVQNFMTPSKGLLIVLAILIPFVAVGLKTDWGMPVVWNLLWTFVGVLPAIIHALIVVNR